MNLTSFRRSSFIYIQCCRWGVQAIITDTTQVWLDLRKELQGMDALWLVTCVCSPFSRGLQQGNRIWPTLPIPLARVLQPSSNGYRYPPEEVLEKIAGPFEKVSMDQATTTVPTPPTIVPPPPAPTATAA
jgi:hypothetical protein